MITTRNSQTFLLLVLALALLGILFMAAGRQVTLPITGIESNRQVMPPDPNEWCKKVDLKKLDWEIEKAEVFFSQNVGYSMIQWRYLERALKYTGVSIHGPQDAEWLRMLKGFYSRCER